ncbi:MCE family protein [Nocardioides sp.]|uniref:MCE family protein n=1 Tax=Nocardioides sp. TaxID=35761 RepID=UPI00351421AC
MRARIPGRGVRAGLALLVGTLAFSGCGVDVYQLPLPGGTDVGDDPINVTVYFNDVLDLVPKSSVKVDDLSVGQVTDVELDGYTAKVELTLRDDVDLPANAVATIRQTSLLGEKFVSLSAPETGASSERLTDDAVIPIERTGRNPEVEEVFSALSLVLNGGGIAKVKTIAQELNKALGGREEAAKSALNQLAVFTGQLDRNKADIVNAIEALNRLAVTARGQIGSIENALDELPSALDSLDAQRGDLVKMLQALEKLGGIGTRVIERSKESTIETIRQLEPVLTQLADSGQNLVDSFNVALTYPFVDEVVGRDPVVADRLQMGDYTNLSVQLDIDLTDPPDLPGIPCDPLSAIPADSPLGSIDVTGLCEDAQDAIAACVNNPSFRTCQALPAGIIGSVCDNISPRLPLLCGRLGASGGQGGTGGLGGVVGGLTGGLTGGLGGLLNRPATGAAATGTSTTRSYTVGELMDLYDPALVGLMIPGMVLR